MFTAHDIIDLAIRLEKNGENVYRDALSHTGNDAMKKMLVTVADEEVRHAEWFSSLKSRIESGEDADLIKEMRRSLIDEFVADQSFSLKDVDFSAINTEKKMLETFIEFEKDTILLYDFLKSFVMDEDTATMLNRIIGQEEEHIKAFRSLLSEVAR